MRTSDTVQADQPGHAGWFARVGAIVRQIIGAPDYETYLRHMQVCHTECEPLSKEQFLAERLNARYGLPGSRCC